MKIRTTSTYGRPPIIHRRLSVRLGPSHFDNKGRKILATVHYAARSYSANYKSHSPSPPPDYQGGYKSPPCVSVDTDMLQLGSCTSGLNFGPPENSRIIRRKAQVASKSHGSLLGRVIVLRTVCQPGIRSCLVCAALLRLGQSSTHH
jgi:hypothetical protein